MIDFSSELFLYLSSYDVLHMVLHLCILALSFSDFGVLVWVENIINLSEGEGEGEGEGTMCCIE